MRRELLEEEKLFLEDSTKKLEESIKSLKSYDLIDFSAPSEDDEVVYLPVEGTFNKKFFTHLYLLRNHVIANEIVSEFDMIQYQIPVKIDNIELILLVYGEHLFSHVFTPTDQLQKPIGTSLCENTDAIIKNRCPVVGIPFSVWDYRDEADRRTAVLVSEEFGRFGDLARKITGWISTNFKLAINDYVHSEWGLVKWTKEYKLFSLMQFWYSETVFQYSPAWLNGQSIDMFIPSLDVGIEYQGEQHYEAIEYFGGEESLVAHTFRDRTKVSLCEDNNVTLYYWPYTKKVAFSEVMLFLRFNISHAEEILNRFVPIPVVDILQKRETYSQTINKSRISVKIERTPQTIIRCYDKNGLLVGEYISIAQATEKSGISGASIQKCLVGEKKTAAGLIWMRQDWGSLPLEPEAVNRFFNISNTYDALLAANSGVVRSVIQIDPATGEIIEIYDSIATASKAVGVYSKKIYNALTKSHSIAGGFQWQLGD